MNLILNFGLFVPNYKINKPTKLPKCVILSEYFQVHEKRSSRSWSLWQGPIKSFGLPMSKRKVKNKNTQKKKILFSVFFILDFLPLCQKWLLLFRETFVFLLPRINSPFFFPFLFLTCSNSILYLFLLFYFFYFSFKREYFINIGKC